MAIATSERTCTACGATKPVQDFPLDRRCKRDGRQARCRECHRAVIAEHYHDNPAHYILRRARSRAKSKGIQCTITLDDLLPLPTHCPVLGTKLIRAGTQHPDGYSLDRLDNERGYEPGNIMVMSYRANRLKNDGTLEDFRKLVSFLEALD